ncbi:hypothetical protein E3N88_03745 [Mikania micrantha]|uniref:RRM domain-containing protein n=1 Tax=Mikania micrantha TaxID=192012 RepID=A0A5N6PTR0_9ASTR|nr:hypothetical protein E3N88_03745 [Mikania micrantha]
MSRVYVGNLDPRVSERELEDEFRVFGVLRNVWVARRPPGYAFVEFDDRRDALDAIRELDGATAHATVLVGGRHLGVAYHLVEAEATAGHPYTAGPDVIHHMLTESKMERSRERLALLNAHGVALL